MEPDAEAVKRNVAAALAEDVGSGDLSADVIGAGVQATAVITSREVGVFCGQAWVEEACRQVDAAIAVDWRVQDGDAFGAGDALAELRGPARGLLTVERTSANFMQLLCGVATRTRRFVDAVAGTGAVILDTRKTLPGLRAAQKYAVRVGGGENHRMGLYDAMLLKENHIASAGGIEAAVREGRRRHPGRLLQVEAETSAELEQAIAAGADRVLLDNFDLEALRAAVRLNNGRVPLEASGGVSLATVAAVARSGVDYISVGQLTKDVQALDLSMRIVAADAAGGCRA